jgi:hypothetical protein
MVAYQQQPTATVREETGFGFAFDTIKIPIPWLRLISVPKPAEVTIRVPPQNFGINQGYPMMSSGVPLMMPMQPSGLMPAGFAPAGFPPQMAGMPMQTNALALQQQIAVQQQQLALLQAQQGIQAGQINPNGVAPPQQALSEDQMEELLRKCEELKKLKAQRDLLKAQQSDALKAPPKEPKEQKDPSKMSE